MIVRGDTCFARATVAARPRGAASLAASARTRADLSARPSGRVMFSVGVQGRDGPPGKDGANASGGAGSTHAFPQSQPALLWTLAHGLNRFPSVTLADTAGDVMDAVITFQDANTVLVSFTAPTAGTAYLN